MVAGSRQMHELFRFVEKPRKCSYLPRETAALEVRAIADLSAAEYGDLLARGYRRFGWQVFRPACPKCAQCRSVRVLPQQWQASGSELRVLRKNQNVRAELHPLSATREHVALYNRYHSFMHLERGWPLQQTTLESYRDEFLTGAAKLGRHWLYFDEDRLIGVAVMDEAPSAISLVYYFYDPDWRANSPGTFSILNQLRYAKRRGFDYAYLGYWVEGCRSMSYKGRFKPRQLLREYPAADSAPVWE
jgi:leucyl-tRNA---protein transferase